MVVNGPTGGDLPWAAVTSATDLGIVWEPPPDYDVWQWSAAWPSFLSPTSYLHKETNDHKPI